MVEDKDVLGECVGVDISFGPLSSFCVFSGKVGGWNNCGN